MRIASREKRKVAEKEEEEENHLIRGTRKAVGSQNVRLRSNFPPSAPCEYHFVSVFNSIHSMFISKRS